MPTQHKEPDTHTTPEEKNSELAKLLLGRWNPIEIVNIERSDSDAFKGWTATEKESDSGPN